ncbi:MAG: zinc ABC transporter substrate-binding protein [Candidatus Latescibacterota bacterium]|nr:MAG: zinc ABC transporter substrate-binding protein [Candidatus Latescibacterota bacterium]
MNGYITHGQVKTAALIWLCVFLCAALPVDAKKLKVVASIPDLGVMAERIGGDKIEVKTLASGREDFHGVPVRPSFIPTLNRADLLLTMGLDAEHSWLPALAQEARNRKIMEDHEAWIEVYDGVEVLNIPDVISRAEGEQHPEGNPHFNVGPHCGVPMAENIGYTLIEFDPDNADVYQTNLDAYVIELEALTERLKEEGKDLNGVTIVSYHSDVSYLASFYGMNHVGTLEPKPGIEPTARHVAELAKKAEADGTKLVIYHQAQCGKLPEKFAKRIGARSVQFANMVGAKKEIKTFIDLQEYNLRVLLEALKEAEKGN